MSEIAREILPVNLEDEMRQSYLDYAMSVIVGRALPDVRDGLKPVHRRVLYAMRELGNDWNKPYKKSARVVGDVIGKYHPHGDLAVYDAIVRMAQPFSLRYMLADGQGNFGSVDGDMPAAMRYTEVRMSRIAHELLSDIDKETVDFVPNYDESEQEPAVLPARIPNLLINGATGIAVGMATNIPPHNLNEVCTALVKMIDSDLELTSAQLCKYIKGPDFPTGGQIMNTPQEIRDIYKTGSGTIRIRATWEEGPASRSGKTIYITSVPYAVNKAALVERIGDIALSRKLPHLLDVKDLSTDDVRIALELKGDADKMLGSLRGASGASFDLAYIDGQVAEHQKVLDTIDQQLLPSATTEKVIEALKRMRETVASHLEEAKSIQSELTQSNPK